MEGFNMAFFFWETELKNTYGIRGMVMLNFDFKLNDMTKYPEIA